MILHLSWSRLIGGIEWGILQEDQEGDGRWCLAESEWTCWGNSPGGLWPCISFADLSYTNTPFSCHHPSLDTVSSIPYSSSRHHFTTQTHRSATDATEPISECLGAELVLPFIASPSNVSFHHSISYINGAIGSLALFAFVQSLMSLRIQPISR